MKRNVDRQGMAAGSGRHHCCGASMTDDECHEKTETVWLFHDSQIAK
ncbi:MAG: hypothetical protein NC344_04905 [Bacteroidales bacterium]|nr:hypothetical protein [Bacteroidales bacterium]MCM1147165.1 hypothetical protein [Bacteroidales bacterium]MCM1205391.1 hypothetical protein [Bacillota bacterium]MCM1509804.1 hypothetical protein [Clostridium sp.]